MTEQTGAAEVEGREALARWFHPEAFDCEWNVSVFGQREQEAAQTEAYKQADDLLASGLVVLAAVVAARGAEDGGEDE